AARGAHTVDDRIRRRLRLTRTPDEESTSVTGPPRGPVGPRCTTWRPREASGGGFELLGDPVGYFRPSHSLAAMCLSQKDASAAASVTTTTAGPPGERSETR